MHTKLTLFTTTLGNDRRHPIYQKDREKWKTFFSRLFGGLQQQRPSNHSVQKADACRQTNRPSTRMHTIIRLWRHSCNECDCNVTHRRNMYSLSDKNRHLEDVFHKNNYSADFIRRNTHRITETTETNRTLTLLLKRLNPTLRILWNHRADH